MMMLGVLIHTACGYTHIPDTWWYTEQTGHWFFDFTILFLHIFRLPVFFVMSGFFAALLFQRRGWRWFLENRAKRLLLPLLLGMLTLYPMMNALQGYTRVWSKPDPLQRSIQFLLSGRYWRWVHPMHLWFLCVLIIIIIVFLAFLPPWQGLPGAARKRVNDSFRWSLSSSWAPYLWALPTLATLLTMSVGLLDTPHTFLPAPRIVLAYLVFFGFGWGIYENVDLLDRFKNRAWTNLGLASALGMLNFLLAMKQLQVMPARHWIGFYGTAITGALVVWLMLFGCAGLFLRYLDGGSFSMRYLSDSAYWVYLFHAPVVLWLQILVAGLAVSPLIKAALVLAGSIPILFASYHFLVRPTLIGVLLNGRRYPIRKSNLPNQNGETLPEKLTAEQSEKDGQRCPQLAGG
ncbi:MAG: acyltransferase family protein [Acidobacteria bacterium]|nr:acyltransferase family protein [Acidobacteriota bacterium]